MSKFVAETHVLDVTDKNAISNLLGNIEEPDVLFNCAGTVHDGSIVDANDEEWDFAFNVNAKAMFHMIQECSL